jgi:hypothetical protein
MKRLSEVAIGIERQGDRAMTEQILDDLGIGPGSHSPRVLCGQCLDHLQARTTSVPRSTHGLILAHDLVAACIERAC